MAIIGLQKGKNPILILNAANFFMSSETYSHFLKMKSILLAPITI